ncbi:MAG: DUF4140 domain-containing protein [Chitinophagales bacterium]
MKNIFFILVVCLCTYTIQILQAQTIAKTLQSKVIAATVYLNAAEVERTTKTQLSAGTHQIVFSNLSNKMEHSSVRLNATNGVKVLSVSTRNQDRRLETKPDFIREIEDSIEMVNDQIEQFNNDLMTYKEEKELLLQNKSIGGAQTGVNITELKQAADFYRSRLKDIHRLQSETKKDEWEQREVLYKLKHRLKDPLFKWKTAKKEVIPC